jgi:hypothetical protein
MFDHDIAQETSVFLVGSKRMNAGIAHERIERHCEGFMLLRK